MGDCRLVVCDDQPAFRELISMVLGLESGIDVVGEAADGLEAIEAVRRHTPDVLLLDVAMPNMDGLEALPFIRKACPNTQVVMVTAFGSEGIRERALAAGAAGFIEKGLDVTELVEQVMQICAAR
jgi:DNA-binding NarL/FixJ family response regulator